LEEPIKPANCEIRDGMRVRWHAPIPTRDSTGLRADLFRPGDEQACAVMLSHGASGKGLDFQKGDKIGL
jgi:predicted acyl esterase